MHFSIYYHKDVNSDTLRLVHMKNTKSVVIIISLTFDIFYFYLKTKQKN